MKLIIAILAGCLSVTAFAQDIPLTVSGKVTDSADGKPIAYASVHLEGTMIGVSTDGEGNYIITIPEDGILVFSSISYKTRQVAVEGRQKLDVALEHDTEYIEETIVVAYGTSTKSAFTGSASMIGAETIESRVTTNVTSALAGTTPGVQVISSSGDPAAGEATIRICHGSRLQQDSPRPPS